MRRRVRLLTRRSLVNRDRTHLPRIARLKRLFRHDKHQRQIKEAAHRVNKTCDQKRVSVIVRVRQLASNECETAPDGRGQILNRVPPAPLRARRVIVNDRPV